MGATGCRADRSKCLTHDLWEELGNQIHAFLSSVTLLDVLERRLTPRIAEAPAAQAAANTDSSMAAAS
jgi:Rrf2 family iron-sulfur cluster assembly transcriptional regulator